MEAMSLLLHSLGRNLIVAGSLWPFSNAFDGINSFEFHFDAVKLFLILCLFVCLLVLCRLWIHSEPSVSIIGDTLIMA